MEEGSCYMSVSRSQPLNNLVLVYKPVKKVSVIGDSI